MHKKLTSPLPQTETKIVNHSPSCYPGLIHITSLLDSHDIMIWFTYCFLLPPAIKKLLRAELAEIVNHIGCYVNPVALTTHLPLHPIPLKIACWYWHMNMRQQNRIAFKSVHVTTKYVLVTRILLVFTCAYTRWLNFDPLCNLRGLAG